jgi:hypothetical protein
VFANNLPGVRGVRAVTVAMSAIALTLTFAVGRSPRTTVTQAM